MTWIACARKCETWNNQGNVGNFMLVPMVKGGRERTTGNEVNGVDRGEKITKGLVFKVEDLAITQFCQI